MKSGRPSRGHQKLKFYKSSIAGVGSKELSQVIFSAGSIIVSNQPEEVITADQKFYSDDDLRYSVSQVEELGMENFLGKKDSLLEALVEFRNKENLYIAALLVTDINSQNSLLLIAGELEFLDRISYPIVESNCIPQKAANSLPYWDIRIFAEIAN